MAGAAAVAAASLLLAGCSGKASSDPSPPTTGGGAAYRAHRADTGAEGRRRLVHLVAVRRAASLSFAYAFDYPPNQVLANVCESLLRWNADLSYSPGLATKFENPTPTTWVYTIRQGVTFHDGTTLTPDDVVARSSTTSTPTSGRTGTASTAT